MKKILINTICLLLALLSGISLFVLKYQVKEQEEILKTIHREILKNKREIHMLEAEWAHLNDPQRLLDLVVAQTDWKTISAKQIATLTDIPMKERISDTIEVLVEEETTEKTKKKAVRKEIVQVAVKKVKVEKSTKSKNEAVQSKIATKDKQALQKGTAALSGLSKKQKRKQ